jgi:hypothetical protein
MHIIHLLPCDISIPTVQLSLAQAGIHISLIVPQICGPWRLNFLSDEPVVIPICVQVQTWFYNLHKEPKASWRADHLLLRKTVWFTVGLNWASSSWQAGASLWQGHNLILITFNYMLQYSFSNL